MFSGVLLGSTAASYCLDLGSVDDIRNVTKRTFDDPILKIRKRVEEYVIRHKETMKGRMLKSVEEREFLLSLRKVLKPPSKDA